MNRDGCTVSGYGCPLCGSDRKAEVLHLEPPYGALVRCEAAEPDPDWGVRRRCGHEFLIAF